MGRSAAAAGELQASKPTSGAALDVAPWVEAKTGNSLHLQGGVGRRGTAWLTDSQKNHNSLCFYNEIGRE